MIISETYKTRLQQLAGIILEISDVDKTEKYSKSNERIPFSKDLMIQAIKHGREVGILFKTRNQRYEMPTSKYRIILPMTIGTSSRGNPVLRAYHVIGQSERKAIETGQRSAEAENEWRLFNTNNIHSMWFTGEFFRTPPPGYNPNDQGMTNVEASVNFTEVGRLQDELFAQEHEAAEELAEIKDMAHVYAGFEEKPNQSKPDKDDDSREETTGLGKSHSIQRSAGNRSKNYGYWRGNKLARRRKRSYNH